MPKGIPKSKNPDAYSQVVEVFQPSAEYTEAMNAGCHALNTINAQIDDVRKEHEEDKQRGYIELAND